MTHSITIPKKLVPTLLREICEEEGLECWIEPDYGFIGYVEHSNGKRFFFRNWNLNVNPLGSVEICKDKDYTATLLRRFGFLVPEGKVFFSDALNAKIEKKRSKNDALLYAENLGYPLIIKPNELSQ